MMSSFIWKVKLMQTWTDKLWRELWFFAKMAALHHSMTWLKTYSLKIPTPMFDHVYCLQPSAADNPWLNKLLVIPWGSEEEYPHLFGNGFPVRRHYCGQFTKRGKRVRKSRESTQMSELISWFLWIRSRSSLWGDVAPEALLLCDSLLWYFQILPPGTVTK